VGPGPAPRLLLTDDEQLNRDMLSRRLARHGYEVVAVPNGPETLAAIEREEFAVLLLDVMMPEMSGLEVLRRIRQTRTPEQLPIIMVTARAQSEDVVEALDLGANDYVT
jgi:DNA-binding response OmpR family regulator